MMNERGKICTETIENSKDSLLQFLARRELEIITEYCRILDALENNQRKEETESRIKTNEELIESLTKEKAELDEKIAKLKPFVKEQTLCRLTVSVEQLLLLWQQLTAMQNYADILSERIEDAKAR